MNVVTKLHVNHSSFFSFFFYYLIFKFFAFFAPRFLSANINTYFQAFVTAINPSKPKKNIQFHRKVWSSHWKEHLVLNFVELKNEGWMPLTHPFSPRTLETWKGVACFLNIHEMSPLSSVTFTNPILRKIAKPSLKTQTRTTNNQDYKKKK